MSRMMIMRIPAFNDLSVITGRLYYTYVYTDIQQQLCIEIIIIYLPVLFPFLPSHTTYDSKFRLLTRLSHDNF